MAPSATAPAGTPLLQVEDLSVVFTTPTGDLHAVRGVSFDLHAGEVLGVVGESGSGKSVTALTIMGLHDRGVARITGGLILLEGRDLLQIPQRELRKLRNDSVAMIFQDPMTSLNPVKTVGWQIAEAIRVHQSKLGSRERMRRAVSLLEMVGVPQPALRAKQYPHEFSGGMRQRVMIAIAIANRPKVLIADEPTTALDVTIQAAVLDVLRVIREETGVATILITHDLGLVAESTDTTVVMYGGRIMEQGPTRQVFGAPSHPYTVGLLGCIPSISGPIGRMVPIPGQPPDPREVGSGCSFAARCAMRHDRDDCHQAVPDLRDVSRPSVEVRSRCHFIEEVPAYAAEVLGATSGTQGVER